jgi:DNA-binding response OmpR family regulator
MQNPYNKGAKEMDFPQRVLIVDDDPVQRAVLKQIFATHGSVAVEAAADGLDAKSIMETSAEPFFLILLDLVIPEHDGIELIANLVSQNVKAGLLLISGLPQRVVEMSNTLAKVSGLRAIGSFQKPIVLEDLLAMVEGQSWRRRRAPKREPEKVMQTGRAYSNFRHGDHGVAKNG